MWMISTLASLLFPQNCLGCSKPATSLCRRCVSLARKSLSDAHGYIVSSFDFKDPLIKKAVHALKYYHRKDVALPLTEQLAHDLLARSGVDGCTIVPIPMPKLRKLLRGYNQAEVIAYELGKALSLPVRSDLLMRIKRPPRQVESKTKRERLKRQRGSFDCSREARGMRILLVDDVTTTGATLEEARKVLLRAGALHVQAATLAH